MGEWMVIFPQPGGPEETPTVHGPFMFVLWVLLLVLVVIAGYACWLLWKER